MNIYQGHQHLVTDIIGLESIASSGSGIATIAINGGLLNGIDGLTASWGSDHFNIPYGDHTHAGIISQGQDILVSYTDSIYSISLSGALSAKLFSPASSAFFYDSNFGLIDADDNTKSATFDTSQITTGTKRTYVLPNQDGYIVVDGGGSGTVIRNSGTPPNAPVIKTSDCTTQYLGKSTYTTIVWEFQVGYIPPGDLSYFVLSHKAADDINWTDTTIMSNSASAYTYTDLMPGKSYYFKVLASDIANNKSVYSEHYSLTIASDSSAPASPTSLSVDVVHGNTIRAEWPHNTEPDLKFYRLYYSPDINFTPSPSNLIYEGTNNSYFGSISISSPSLYFKASAVDFSLNESTFRNAVLVVSLTPETPILSSIATGSNIETDGSCYINLSYTDSVVRQYTGFVNYVYRIKKVGESDDNYFYYTGTTSTTFRTHDVIPNVDYEISVAASNSSGVLSSFSSKVFFTTARDIVPPGIPTSLVARSSFNAIILSWVNPTDKDLSGIKVFRNTSGVFSNSDAIATSYGTSFTDVGIDQGTEYFYWIKAVDTSGNESSNTTSVSGTSIQLYPEQLSTEAKMDFVLNDAILSFSSSGSPLLSITTIGASGNIVRGSGKYNFTSTTVSDAANSYIIATCVSGTNVATFSRVKFSSNIPTLATNQAIVALTSSALSNTNFYQCYVRQSNSMAIDGAIIQNATITTAKIKELDAAIINAVEINADSITIGSTGSHTLTYAADKAIASTRNYYMGDWSRYSIAYQSGDEVTSSGSTWVCILNHTSSVSNGPPLLPTTSNTWWSVRSQKGADGLAITVLLTNQVYAVSTDATGNAGTYTGSDTEIHVYEGATELVYDGDGTLPGTYNVTTEGINITAAPITGMSIYAFCASGYNMTADTAKINYTVSGHDSAGNVILIMKTQSFSKVKAGIAYDIVVESTNGNMFRVGQSKSTTLIGHVFKNGVDVTDEIDASKFRWRRVSYNDNPSGDAVWNAQYIMGYKQISITVDSVDTIATFHLDILD